MRQWKWSEELTIELEDWNTIDIVIGVPLLIYFVVRWHTVLPFAASLCLGTFAMILPLPAAVVSADEGHPPQLPAGFVVACALIAGGVIADWHHRQEGRTGGRILWLLGVPTLIGAAGGLSVALSLSLPYSLPMVISSVATGLVLVSTGSAWAVLLGTSAAEEVVKWVGLAAMFFFLVHLAAVLFVGAAFQWQLSVVMLVALPLGNQALRRLASR